MVGHIVRSLRFAALTALLMTPRAYYAQENTVKIEEQKSFNVIGLAVRTNNKAEATGQGEIPKLWKRFVEQDTASRIPNRAEQNLIVVYTDYATDETGEYTYLVGSRVTSSADVPAG